MEFSGKVMLQCSREVKSHADLSQLMLEHEGNISPAIFLG